MASIQLKDGRVVPIVKPHIGDQMDLERQMRATRKDYGAADFQEDLKLTSFVTAFALFASLRRAGEQVSIDDVLSMDLEELGNLLKLEPGDEAIEGPGSEGEQTSDPQLAPTVAAAAAA